MEKLIDLLSSLDLMSICLGYLIAFFQALFTGGLIGMRSND